MSDVARQTVAVAGVTGVVGREFLRILEERAFPVGRLVALASARSAGRSVEFAGEQIVVEDLEQADFAGVDVAFFSAGGERSLRHAPRAAAWPGTPAAAPSAAVKRVTSSPLVSSCAPGLPGGASDAPAEDRARRPRLLGWSESSSQGRRVQVQVEDRAWPPSTL